MFCQFAQGMPSFLRSCKAGTLCFLNTHTHTDTQSQKSEGKVIDIKTIRNCRRLSDLVRSGLWTLREAVSDLNTQSSSVRKCSTVSAWVSLQWRIVLPWFVLSLGAFCCPQWVRGMQALFWAQIPVSWLTGDIFEICSHRKYVFPDLACCKREASGSCCFSAEKLFSSTTGPGGFPSVYFSVKFCDSFSGELWVKRFMWVNLLNPTVSLFRHTFRRVALCPIKSAEEDIKATQADGNSKSKAPTGPKVPVGWKPVAVTLPWLLNFLPHRHPHPHPNLSWWSVVLIL